MRLYFLGQSSHSRDLPLSPPALVHMGMALEMSLTPTVAAYTPRIKCIEFVGAVALCQRVNFITKNSIIISLSRYEDSLGALMLAMIGAEVGSTTWLMVATKLGYLPPQCYL